MAELFIFNQDQEFITTITEEDGLISALFREEINQIPETPFWFTIKADSEVAKYVIEENHVVFRDKEGELRLYVIKELDDEDSEEGPYTTAICFPSWVEELKENIIEDRRILNKEAQEALNIALLGTRYVGEVEVSLGLNSTNFYYISSVEAVWDILSTWGGEVKDVVEFDEMNNITERKIKILQRRGADRGKRFEIDHDIQIINRTVLSYPITALYGHGASLPTEEGGYTRYIDFADVEWSVADGDPVDKPLGQKWVGDPVALAKYGRLHNGQRIHRKGKVSNYEIEDPAELLQWTWEQLKNASKPEIRYRMSVFLLESFEGYEHEKVELGDTAIAIDRKFSRPIEIQTRVIAIEYDLLDIEGTAVVEMGQFLSFDSSGDRIDELEEVIRNNRGKWEAGAGPITNERFPDIKPTIPQNVYAVGGFKQIQLYWDVDINVYVNNYEVYGSKISGFVPDSQHLLFRGHANSFVHDVGTDEVWYYRVRALNTHGTPSEFSNEVSASTVRVISDDILFGEDLAAKLRDLSAIAPILANGSIGFDMFSVAVKSSDGTRIKGDLISIDGTTYIANGVIGNAAIANGAISKAKMGTASVGTLQVEDGAITRAKIANLAVDDAKIANLDASKLKANSIIANTIKFTGILEGATGIFNGDLIQVGSWGTIKIQDGSTHISGTKYTGTGMYDNYSVNTRYSSVGVDGYIYNGVYDRRFILSPQRLIMDSMGGLEHGGLEIRNSYWSPPKVQFNGLRNATFEFNISSGDESTGVFTKLLELTKTGATFSTRLDTKDIYVDGANSIFTNAIDHNGSGVHLYARPLSGGELRATVKGSTSTYVPIRAQHFYAVGSFYGGANATFNSDSGYVVVRAGSGIVYLQSSTEVRATLPSQGSSYIPVRASSFPTGSLAEYKQDIQRWEGSALEQIREATIYEYHLKIELEKGIYRKRQGLVIGDGFNTPLGVVDGDGVEQYLMNAWSWKAIQELDATQREILDDINWLKMENQLLKQKLNELEAKVA